LGVLFWFRLDVETGLVNCCRKVPYRIISALHFTESLGNDL
jgi:hypothetical protein